VGWSRPSAASRLLSRLRRRDPRALAGALGALAVPALLAGAWFGWLGPRRTAEAFARDHARWEAQVLEPWALGGGEAAPARDEVAERLRRLRDARRALGAGAEIDRALELLEAAHLLLTGAVDEAQSSSRSAPQLVAEARLALGEDDRGRARRRVRRALSLEPEFLPAQLLRYELEADDDPLAFLQRAAEIGRTAPQVLERTAPRVAARLCAEAVRAGPGGVERVVAVGQALDRLHPALPGVPEAKRAALEAVTPEWCQALREACGSRTELEWVTALATVVNATPTVRLGAPVVEALQKTLQELFYVGFTELPLKQRVRPIMIEDGLYYDVDAEWPATDSLRGALMSIALLDKPELTPREARVVALACARAGAPMLFSTIAKQLPRQGWEQLIRERAQSRAAHLGLGMRLAEDLGLASAPLAQRVIATLEPALEPDAELLDDIAPQNLGYALHMLAGARLQLLTLQETDLANQAAQLALLRREAGQARGLLQGQLRLYVDSLHAEVQALEIAEGPAEALAFVAPEIPEALRIAEANSWARDSTADTKFQLMDMTSNPYCEVAELERDCAVLLLELDRPEEALARAQAGLELALRQEGERQSGPPHHLEHRALIAQVQRKLDRDDEARATLQPYLEQGAKVFSFVVQQAWLLVHTGELDEARVWVQRARRQSSPEHPEVLELEEHLSR
jgi:hypothetical protein